MWTKPSVFIIAILTIWLNGVYVFPEILDSMNDRLLDSTTESLDSPMGTEQDVGVDEQLIVVHDPDGNRDLNIDTSKELVLFSFDNTSSTGHWRELSDASVWPTGMSKATFVLQKTKTIRQAIFFSLLNPQASGAAFAGQRIDVRFDLSKYTTLLINCRARGENYNYKISLRHNGKNNDPYPSYEHIFKMNKGEFETVALPLSNFEPYIHGQKDPNGGPLNLQRITNFELQMFGGVYEPYKQSGASSLEILWIKAVAETPGSP